MPKKKEVTTKRGQHHKSKTFVINLIKDISIMKVDANVVRKNPDSFEKKKVTFEKRNEDPIYFPETLRREFSSLTNKEFSLWRLSKDTTTLIELPPDINNASALCNYEELNRSHLYIRLQESKQMNSSVPDLIDAALPYFAPSAAMDTTEGVQSVEIMAKNDKSGNLVSQGKFDIATIIGADGQLMFQPLQPPSATQVLLQSTSSFQEVLKDDDQHMILDMSSGIKSDDLPRKGTKRNSSAKRKGDNQLHIEAKRHKNSHMQEIQENPSTLAYAYVMDNDNVQPKFNSLFNPEGMVYNDSAVAGPSTDFNNVPQYFYYLPTVDPRSESFAAFSNIPQPGPSSQSDAVVNPQNYNFVPQQPSAIDAIFQQNDSSHSQPMTDNHELPLYLNGTTEPTNNTFRNPYSSHLEPAQHATQNDYIPESNINPGNGDQTDSADDEDNDDVDNEEEEDDNDGGNGDDENGTSQSSEVFKAEDLGRFETDYGVLDGTVLNGKIYFIHKHKDTLTVNSNTKPFRQEGEIKINGMKYPRSIAACAQRNCLYISDGCRDTPKVIWLVKVGHQVICEKLMEDVECCGLSSTRDGDLLLLDSKNNCLHFYRSDGRCFRCVKLPSVENFGKPEFVIASLEDNFYISSSPFNRMERRLSFIYKLSSCGDLLETFGGKAGSGPGQLSDSLHPLAPDKHGRVIVGDGGNKRVILLDSNLQFLTTLIEDYPAKSNMLFCDDADCVFFNDKTWRWKIRAFRISEFRTNSLLGTSDQVLAISPTGADEPLYLNSIYPDQQRKIRGVAVLLDRIYILTEKGIGIYYAKNPFKELYYQASFSVSIHNLSDFWDISADATERRLYVTDKGNRCVWSLGIDLIRKTWLTDLGSPYTISVTRDGSVIIPSKKHRRIDIYDKRGQQQKRINIQHESMTLQIRHAVKLLNKERDLYAVCHGLPWSDFDNEHPVHEVFIISSDGVILLRYGGQFGPGTDYLYIPSHLTLVRNGDLFVADSKNNRVLRLNEQLTLQEVRMTKDNLGINEPQRLCYDESSGLLLVCNSKSVYVFSCNFEAKHRNFTYHKVGETNSTSATNDKDAEGLETGLPTVQLIDRMEDQMQKDKCCVDVAVLNDCLYLIYYAVNTVYMHQSHCPFALQRAIVIEDMKSPRSIEASSEHDCLYIMDQSKCNTHKIWRLMSNGQTAEIFLTFASEYEIRHMSVAENGHLLVTLYIFHEGYGCALYEANGKCIESNYYEKGYYPQLCIKIRNGGIITFGGLANDYMLSKVSRDGTLLHLYGPFSEQLFNCSQMSVGGEGQILVSTDLSSSLLVFDHHGRFVGTLLDEDERNFEEMQGFFYDKDKKRLWICYSNKVFSYQLNEKKPGRSKKETALCKKKFLTHLGEGSWGQLQYETLIINTPVRSLATLEEKTYFLRPNKVSVHLSKELRTIEEEKDSIAIPEQLTFGRVTDLWDIAASPTDHCLYVTDRNNKCVWSLTLDHKIKKWLENIGPPYTLSVSEDGCVCILDSYYKKLNIYYASGSLKKFILLPRDMMYPLHAVHTPTGNYIISWAKNNKSVFNNDDHHLATNDYDVEDVICDEGRESEGYSESDESNCVCEISEDGKVLRTFNRHVSSSASELGLCKTVPRLVKPCHLALDPNGRVFVADYDRYGSVLLLDPQLQFMEDLIENFSDDECQPKRLCYDKSAKELLIIESCPSGDFILKCIKMS